MNRAPWVIFMRGHSWRSRKRFHMLSVPRGSHYCATWITLMCIQVYNYVKWLLVQNATFWLYYTADNRGIIAVNDRVNEQHLEWIYYSPLRCCWAKHLWNQKWHSFCFSCICMVLWLTRNILWNVTPAIARKEIPASHKATGLHAYCILPQNHACGNITTA